MAVVDAVEVRPVVHATYELMHRTWVIRAQVADGREITAAAARLVDVESAIRSEVSQQTQLPPDAYELQLTHVMRANQTWHEPDVALLLTAAEVADLLHVNVRTVYRWTREGKLDSMRTVNGRRLFDVGAVRRLLDNDDTVDEPPAVDVPLAPDVSLEPATTLPVPTHYRWFVAAPTTNGRS